MQSVDGVSSQGTREGNVSRTTAPFRGNDARPHTQADKELRARAARSLA